MAAKVYLSAAKALEINALACCGACPERSKWPAWACPSAVRTFEIDCTKYMYDVRWTLCTQGFSIPVPRSVRCSVARAASALVSFFVCVAVLCSRFVDAQSVGMCTCFSIKCFFCSCIYSLFDCVCIVFTFSCYTHGLFAC